ncbi:hypothetical protein EPN87_04140 [archaeon]|nr:MAG: hypothetical protein EPN87_04140 [archaeon]
MKIKLTIFILISIVFYSQLTLAATQDLTYDNPTNQVNMTYDSLNRILTKNSTTINITYAYDNQYQGTLSNITFDNSTYTYEYDNKLRVTRETRTIDGIQFDRRNYYDSMDRLVKQIPTPGQTMDYYYNNQSKLSKILNFVNSTFYNAFDNMLNRTYFNAKVTQSTYDSQNGRLVQIKTGAIQQLNYTYDNAGNIISINDTVNNRNYSMSYDFLDRLASTTIGGNTFGYSYNAIGNILKIVRDNINTTKFIYGSNPIHAPLQISTGDAGIDVSKQSELYSSNKTRIVKFYLSNEKNATLTNTNWSVNFGNGIINSTVPFNISSNDSVLVIAPSDSYTNSGDYGINITGTANTSVDFENQSVKFGVKIIKLALKTLDVSNATFELVTYNDMNITSQDISWQCDSASAGPFTLAGYSNRTDTFSINYTSPGSQSLSCAVTSVDGNDTKTINSNIKGIAIENVNTSSVSTDNMQAIFNITNYWYPSTITWYIATDGQTFTNQAILGTNASTTVSQNITYTTDGTKTLAINISSGNLTDFYNYTFTIKSLGIYDYNIYNLDGTSRLLSFFIKNYWTQNQSIQWNISNPSVASNINLTSNEPLIVLVTNNYTDSGRQLPTINAYNGSSSDSYIGNFMTKALEITRNLALLESQSDTIRIVTAVNNMDQQAISWLFNTGGENITSTTNVNLNASEQVFIIIQNNYTTGGIYLTNITVNSTSYNDTASGFSVT